MTYLKSIQVENEVGDIISPNTEQSTEMLLEGILKELRSIKSSNVYINRYNFRWRRHYR